MAEPACIGCQRREETIVGLTLALGELQGRVAAQEAEILDLKARLGQNSSNSSKPPSSDPPQTPARPAKTRTGRKPGGQPGHPGHHRTRLPADRVNDTKDLWPVACERCQAKLPQSPQADDPEPQWHQFAEIPKILAHVTEYLAHGSHCPGCGHCTWAEFPADIRAHAFGPNLVAIIVYLSGFFRGSKRMIEELVEDLFSIPISLGTVSNLEQEASAALVPPYEEAQQAVQAAAAKNTDETGWFEAGKPRWLWMAATQTVAVFMVCLKRGKKALADLLGDVIQGVVSCDRWSAYNGLDPAFRQSCWAHLKRDFQKWLDRGGVGIPIGEAGLEAARRLFGLWRDFREGRLDRPALRAALKEIQDALEAALQTGAASEDKPLRRFCRRILKLFPTLWTFARIEGVEPTNNHAERTLRRAVIWRKVSFGNHSEAGCRFAERILTVIQTLRLQGRPVLDYLRQTIAAHRSGGPAPRLCGAGA